MRIPLVRTGNDQTPTAWWEYLFTPVLLMLLVVVAPPMIVIGGAYAWLYPERQANGLDISEDPKDLARLARWRGAYARMSFTERFRRAWKLSKRRRRRRKS